MGMPKWEYPGCTHMKIKMGPKWDQHGNAQVGMPMLVPIGFPGQNVVGPNWATHMGPMWAILFSNWTWDPLGSEVGPSWKIERGSQLGPTCITHGQAHSGPMWARRTKHSGSHLGCPSGSHFAAHFGPNWVPCGIPVVVTLDR